MTGALAVLRPTTIDAYVAAGRSIPDAAALVGIRPSSAKRHLADLRANRVSPPSSWSTSEGLPDGW